MANADQGAPLRPTLKHSTGPALDSSDDRQNIFDHMIVDSYDMPIWRNLLVACFNWLLLAGFVVFPGTFTSLSRLGILDGNPAGRLVLLSIRHTSLLYLASFCCILGALGLCWTWWTVRHNYVWLVSRIFL